MQIKIHDKTYPMATTLRVAYMLQGENNHKPYSEVFKEIGDMGIEKQISLLYTSFKCANPPDAAGISQLEFLNYYLDNLTLNDVMTQLKELIEGITGEKMEEVTSTEIETRTNTVEGN